MRTIFCLLLLLAYARTAVSQIYLVDTNASYFEDFNTLDSFGTGSAKLPPGWSFNEFGSASNTTYRAGTGSISTSDTYSFGPLRSRDRALGSLASGTLTKIVYGTMFVNQTGSDINAMSITYRGEQWRRGGSAAPDSLRCYFTTVRGTNSGDSATARWTEAPGLLFRSVSTLSGSATLNGNDSFRILHADIPLMLHPGDTLWLRWADINAAGSDDGLAIDSLSIEFRNGDISQSNHPRLLAFSPDSTSSGLGTDLQLRLEFDRGVTPGAGYISVWNLETNQIDRVPAVNGQAGNSAREFVFAGIRFEPGSRYIIRFDSSAFDSLGFECAGFYATDWTFRVAPVGVAEPTAGAFTLNPTIDGRLLLQSGTGERIVVLHISAPDGRLLQHCPILLRSGSQIVDAGLARGGCYVIWIAGRDLVLRKLICVP